MGSLGKLTWKETCEKVLEPCKKTRGCLCDSSEAHTPKTHNTPMNFTDTTNPHLHVI